MRATVFAGRIIKAIPFQDLPRRPAIRIARLRPNPRTFHCSVPNSRRKLISSFLPELRFGEFGRQRSWGCRCQMERRRNRGNSPRTPRRRCAQGAGARAGSSRAEGRVGSKDDRAVRAPSALTCARKFGGPAGAGGRKATDPMEMSEDDQSRKSAKTILRSYTLMSMIRTSPGLHSAVR
jgi:hypothetical protein